MSESGDYDPGPWRGHDFGVARARYDRHVGRSYSDAKRTGKKKNEYFVASLETQSSAPLVIAVDVTGSMGDWPATIFSKLPYLDKEGQEYLGKDMEISFAAVGDAYSDSYPLQVRPFTKGTDLKKRLEELIIEGNGGGQATESYDLAALYYAKNVQMPNAIKPIFIFVGDEGLYDFVSNDQAKDHAGVKLEGRLSAQEALDELKQKYSVYLIRKPYDYSGGDYRSPIDKKIQEQWESYLGADHVSILPEAGRVVDVIFGVLAKETARVPYFRKELEDRQKPGQVKTVLKALETIHALPEAKEPKLLKSGKSMTRNMNGGLESKPLL